MNAMDIAMAAINIELNKLRDNNKSLILSTEELRLRLQTIQNELSGERIKTSTAVRENSLNQSRLASIQEELKVANKEKEALKDVIFMAKDVLESKTSPSRKEAKIKSVLGEVKPTRIPLCRICGER